MQKDGDVYTLRISEAFPEDEGVYKCIATNPVGDVTLSAELRVLGEDLIYSIPPITQISHYAIIYEFFKFFFSEH